MMKIPASMYGKGPKNNPAPKKSWDTSGNHAYGDAKIRGLQASSSEPVVKEQFDVSLTDFEMNGMRK